MNATHRAPAALRIRRALLALLVVAAATPALAEEDHARLFRTSDRCLACHNNLTSPTAGEISIGYDWRSSMMANAARDPYWHASVRREVTDNPTLRAAIEDKCSTCHMPMARFLYHAVGRDGPVFAHLDAAPPDPVIAERAIDGVTCSLCHEIEADGLGDPESFTGGFSVDTKRPLWQRQIYGPFEVDKGRSRVMRSSSSLEPVAANHVQGSELCATCHTLYTHAYDAQGREVGELPEQVPYLEWQHSDYADAMSCQDCHMPEVEGSASPTSVLPNPREAVSRHAFRGGNFFMPRLYSRFRDELGVVALPQELEATARQTEAHLTKSSAEVTVERVEVVAGQLRADVRVTSQAGHKLPTAYPSRRAWLHVTVRDRGGQLLFESGAHSADGSIDGNDNDNDATRYEPHHQLIDRPEAVQIYEAILVDADGRVTTGLLRGVRYAKDNRLLPEGFDKTTAKPDIAVQGAAADDPDFTGGTDTTRFAVDVSSAEGPFQVRVELWYQPIGFRWAHNLGDLDAAEPRRFVAYYKEMAPASAMLLAAGEANSR